MRHVAAFVVIALACVLVPAQRAEAQTSIMEWLERLSGPGPFEGPGIHVNFACYGYKKESAIAADPEITTEAAHAKVIAAQRWFPDFGCGKAARNLVRISVGAHVAWLSGDNNLSYDPSVPADETRDVDAHLYQGTVDFGLHRSVEVGFGAGFVRFSQLPVDPLMRAALQPIRLTWKPFAMFGRTGGNLYGREALHVQFIGSWFPGGFKAEDFGAIPGTFDSGNEIQASLGVGVDVLALVALFR